MLILRNEAGVRYMRRTLILYDDQRLVRNLLYVLVEAT